MFEENFHKMFNGFPISDEVLIHRLNWLNIWTHPSPGDSSKVRGICWCPDEKIIAIGLCPYTIFFY